MRALADPVQRHWLLDRLRNRWPAAPETSVPAYRNAIPAAEAPGRTELSDLTPPKSTTVLLTLPGGDTLRVAPGKPDGLVDRHWSDPATTRAFHGFAWIAQDSDGMALATLWPAWLDRYGAGEHPARAWNADVVAERSLALLDMARRHGLPGPRDRTLAALSGHAHALLASFAGTSAPAMALTRRAQALIRLGLELAMPATAEFGFTALLAESERLMLPSGVANVDSTHYHLRLCQTLADAWLAAIRHDRPQAAALEAVLRRAMSVVPPLTLPGGLPFVGDVVEDLPVGWLKGLLRNAPMDQGWTGRLPANEQARLGQLRDDCLPADLEALRADGWLRLDLGPWSGLWHTAIGGWPAFDGHGHQDTGSCELHFAGVPVFVDPGGGGTGAINGCNVSRRAAAHGGLQLNGRDPYPFDHPDYSDAFRREIVGTPPSLRAEFDGASLTFGKLGGGDGLREGNRRWHFLGDGFGIDEMLNGTGRALVTRRFLTPLTVRREDPRTVRLEGGGQRFRLIADQPVSISDGCRWKGFGVTEPLHVIEISGRFNLPWRGSLRVVACQDLA